MHIFSNTSLSLFLFIFLIVLCTSHFLTPKFLAKSKTTIWKKESISYIKLNCTLVHILQCNLASFACKLIEKPYTSDELLAENRTHKLTHHRMMPHTSPQQYISPSLPLLCHIAVHSLLQYVEREVYCMCSMKTKDYC